MVKLQTYGLSFLGKNFLGEDGFQNVCLSAST